MHALTGNIVYTISYRLVGQLHVKTARVIDVIDETIAAKPLSTTSLVDIYRSQTMHFLLR